MKYKRNKIIKKNDKIQCQYLGKRPFTNLDCPIQDKTCTHSTLFGREYICKIKLNELNDLKIK